MRDAHYYHCANEPQPPTIGGIRDRVQDLWTLCGVRVIGYIWDYPKDFANDKGPSDELPKCPKCENHPDYALMVLADT